MLWTPYCSSPSHKPNICANTCSLALSPGLEAPASNYCVGALPPNITIAPISSTTLSAYRRLINTLLPIRYPDRFYKESISDPFSSHSISLCALYNDNTAQNGKRKRDVDDIEATVNVVAGIQARLEILPSSPPTSSITNSQPLTYEYQLYIQTLATLSPHRRLSLASQLLHSLILTALGAHPRKRITSIYAHVWEANEDALKWYLNRGFSIEGSKIEGYYRRLRPGGAWLLRRRICVSEYLEASETQISGAFIPSENLTDEGGANCTKPSLESWTES